MVVGGKWGDSTQRPDSGQGLYRNKGRPMMSSLMEEATSEGSAAKPRQRRGQPRAMFLHESGSWVGQGVLQSIQAGLHCVISAASAFRTLPQAPHWPSLKISCSSKIQIVCLFFNIYSNLFWKKHPHSTIEHEHSLVWYSLFGACVSHQQESY